MLSGEEEDIVTGKNVWKYKTIKSFTNDNDIFSVTKIKLVIMKRNLQKCFIIHYL